MVGLFECVVQIGGVPHFYNLGLAWCVELCVDLPEVDTACRPPIRRQNPLCRPPGGRHGLSTTDQATKPLVSTSERSTRLVDHPIDDKTHLRRPPEARHGLSTTG